MPLREYLQRFSKFTTLEFTCKSNEVNVVSIAIYPAAFFAGYYLTGYLISTPFYEGYQIAKALRVRRLKRSTKKWNLPASDSVEDANPLRIQ